MDQLLNETTIDGCGVRAEPISPIRLIGSHGGEFNFELHTPTLTAGATTINAINLPATVGDGNWTWRLPWPVEELMTDPVASARAAFLRELGAASGR